MLLVLACTLQGYRVDTQASCAADFSRRALYQVQTLTAVGDRPTGRILQVQNSNKLIGLDATWGTSNIFEVDLNTYQVNNLVVNLNIRTHMKMVYSKFDGFYYYCGRDSKRVIYRFDLDTNNIIGIAGTTSSGGYANGPGASAQFGDTWAIEISKDGRVLYVLDRTYIEIRRIMLDTDDYMVDTLVKIYQYASSILLDSDDVYMYVGCYSRIDRIHMRTKQIVSPYAGDSWDLNGFQDGGLLSARFLSTNDMQFIADAWIVVSDGGNGLIRLLDTTSQTVTTIAGSLGTFGFTDAVGTAAVFQRPFSMSVTHDKSTLIVAETGTRWEDYKTRLVTLITQDRCCENNKICFLKCNAGYTGPDDSCVPCEAGKFKTAGGSEACTSCVANSHSTSGSSYCTCNTGFFMAENGICTSSECAAGSTGPNGGPCLNCEAGKYKLDTGSADCTDCPMGKYHAAV